MTPAGYIVRIIASVFQVTGLGLTAWRICIRVKIYRFWWEDAFAAILLLTGLAWMIAQWVFLLANGLTSTINMWIYSIGFSSIVMLVRMSILFSIIRIIHGNPLLLKFTHACVAFYLACYVTLVTEKSVQCASMMGWQHQSVRSEKPFCLMKSWISIFEFTTDCVAVLILVVLPLRMLWRVKLPRRQRRMILSIFASSIVLAVGAILNTVGRILNIDGMMIVGLNVEVAFSLCVCNLLVVVTYVYRYLLHDRGSDETTTETDDDFTTPAMRPTQTASLQLTAVDSYIPTSTNCLTTEMTQNVQTSCSHERAGA